MELFRDQAAERFEVHTGTPWRPRSGSQVNHRTLTTGLDFNDHRLIWDRLDKVHTKHPDMVLLHGGSPKGAELIAAKMDEQPQGAADRLQARLNEAREGRPVQAQRRDARGPADRRPSLPGHGHPGQPRRQGEEARHPRLEIWRGRRVSAA